MPRHHNYSPVLKNLTLSAQGLIEDNDSHHSDHLILCIAHIMMALWACMANCSQILNVMLNTSLRNQTKNILVVNVCVIELVIGAFLCPLYSESLMQGTWRLDVNTCIVYEVIFYAQVSISTLSVLILVIERFYYLLNPRIMTGSEKYCVMGILLTLPWGIGAALVVPVFLEGAKASFIEGTSSCQILWTKELQAVTVFVSFFCPAFLVLTMAAAVVMLYVVFSVIAKSRELSHNPERFLMRDSLRVVLLASMTCVTLQFPFFIVLLMEIFCKRDTYSKPETCGQSETTWAVVAGITMLKPGLMPLTWLAYSDIRNGLNLRNCLTCLRHRARHRHSQENTGASSYTLTKQNRPFLSTPI